MNKIARTKNLYMNMIYFDDKKWKYEKKNSKRPKKIWNFVKTSLRHQTKHSWKNHAKKDKPILRFSHLNKVVIELVRFCTLILYAIWHYVRDTNVKNSKYGKFNNKHLELNFKLKNHPKGWLKTQDIAFTSRIIVWNS